MKKLLSILALALCFVACQNEGVENPTNGDLANVVLTVDAPELGATRADGDQASGKNSAFGAIDFFNDADWANYDLRYILEVYDADDDGTGEPIYRERLTQYLDKYAPTQFDLRLVPNREYKFVVFADFVEQGTQDDLYYDTTDLRNIVAKTGAEGWNAMNEARDAYFVTENVEVSTSFAKTLTLTRPFAKLRVIATDLDYIAGYSAPGYVTLKYHTEALYKSFNAVNGELNNTQLADNELVYGFEVKKDTPYSEGYDAEAKNQTLFADYLFACEGQQIPVNFTMSVYESEGGRLIKTTDFNTQIPVQRNHLTTIIGDVLTTVANITVVVDDNFEDEWINPVMETIDAPVVTATAEANTVTLTWEAVEGAAKYFTRLVTEGNTAFEETTERTKVYADLAWETEYTFEVYAVSEKGIISETTAVKATTEEEPVALAAPVVTCSVDVNVVTLNWAAVEGAAHYTVQVDDDVEEVVKDTTYVFNGDYNVEYMFTVKAIAADYKKNYDSEAAVVTVTTEAEPVVTPTETKLYFQPNSNWKVDNARFAAYFFGNGETWVDLTLVEGETDIYELTLPAGYPNIIFCRMNPTATANNWNNKWNQTADLVVPTDGKNLFILASGSWDGATTSWSTYTPAVVEPETPVAGSQVSVAKFLEMADTETEYVLTGKVARVVNAQYGNFDLTDETGTIYIYGLVSPTGAAQYWAESGVREGDTITVKGKYSVYNNSPQVKNAVYVSHVPAPFVFAEAAAIEADVVEVSISVESNVAWTVSCDAAWVKSYSKSGTDNSDIDIEVEANTTTDNRVATFTISGEGVADFTVTLTQYGAGASDTKGTYTSEAFFKGGTDGGKSYQEKVNVGGTQCDCLKLGTSSAIGKYTTKAVGESGDLTLSFYAVGWNGKNSKLNVYVDGVKVGETLTLKSNSGAANNAPYTITPSDTTDYYSISVPGITETSKITFETVSGATRAIIFGVQLY